MMLRSRGVTCGSTGFNSTSPPERRTYVQGPALAPPVKRSEDGVVVLIVVLLVLWLITTVIGFAFKGLLWLAIIGIILFVGTTVIGFVRRKARHR